MKKWKLLPKLALTGVFKNGNVYLPFMAAGIFSVFTYFVFSSILHNDIIKTLPNSSYAWMLLSVGKGLLACILLPFLFYTNSFIIKRRKKEIGLYHILGLEKKHIGSMMFLETALIYLIVTAGGIASGIVLSKLLFLLLLRMSGLAIQVEFVFYQEAFVETIVYFFWVYAINFSVGLIEVGKSKPVELMSGSKKGEKEPKRIWFHALLGMITLGIGYRIAITSKIDEMIFMNFFLAVFLVVAGTYFLFTSGSVAFLKLIKKKNGIYYKPRNFITISGMLYRMKKNAASLSNICIFSTMVIITLICTTSLYIGMDDISDFDWPYDLIIHYRDSKISSDTIENKINDLEEKYDCQALRLDVFDQLNLSSRKEGNSFISKKNDYNYSEDYPVEFVMLEDYNRITDKMIQLSEKEVLIYCSGADFGYGTVNFFGREFQIKEELKEFYPMSKAEANTFGAQFMIVVKDKAVRDACASAWAQANGVEDMEAFLNSETQYVNLLAAGDDNDSRKSGFLKEFSEWSQSQPGFSKLEDGVTGRAKIISMCGGLLFIGILFSLIFFMCLILIMYYKQISEGYEDKESFGIMQKVGMSDKEIKGTVHRQILMVFCLPLAGAVLHTTAGMFMVERLMATIRLFNTPLMIMCTILIEIVFIVLYGISYLMTAKTYYRIVKQM